MIILVVMNVLFNSFIAFADAKRNNEKLPLFLGNHIVSFIVRYGFALISIVLYYLFYRQIEPVYPDSLYLFLGIAGVCWFFFNPVYNLTRKPPLKFSYIGFTSGIDIALRFLFGKYAFYGQSLIQLLFIIIGFKNAG